jgi:hypothetical protein
MADFSARVPDRYFTASALVIALRVANVNSIHQRAREPLATSSDTHNQADLLS